MSEQVVCFHRQQLPEVVMFVRFQLPAASSVGRQLRGPAAAQAVDGMQLLDPLVLGEGTLLPEVLIVPVLERPS